MMQYQLTKYYIKDEIIDGIFRRKGDVMNRTVSSYRFDTLEKAKEEARVWWKNNPGIYKSVEIIDEGKGIIFYHSNLS